MLEQILWSALDFCGDALMKKMMVMERLTSIAMTTEEAWRQRGQLRSADCSVVMITIVIYSQMVANN